MSSTPHMVTQLLSGRGKTSDGSAIPKRFPKPYYFSDQCLHSEFTGTSVFLAHSHLVGALAHTMFDRQVLSARSWLRRENTKMTKTGSWSWFKEEALCLSKTVSLRGSHSPVWWYLSQLYSFFLSKYFLRTYLVSPNLLGG